MHAATTTTTTTNTTRRRAVGGATLAATLVLLAGAGVEAQIDDVPPWEACQVRIDSPAAFELGPLLNPYVDPGAEVRAVLHGAAEVGTDCSAYDLPV